MMSGEVPSGEGPRLCATATRAGHREDITRRLWAFYRWCADANIPELTTLAATIETWCPRSRCS